MGNRIGKAIRRNKVAFAAGSAVAASLIIGLVAFAWMFFKERVARQRAVTSETRALTEATKSRQVARFLQDMVASAGPSVAAGRDTALLYEILDKTATRIGHDLRDQPEVEAEIRTILGRVYLELAFTDDAEEMHREALRLRRAVFGNFHASVIESLNDLVRAVYNRPDSEANAREALMIGRQLFGNEHPHIAYSLVLLGGALFHKGKGAEAQPFLREGVAMQEKLLGPSRESAYSRLWLAMCLPRRTEGEAILREALEIQRRVLGNEHRDITHTLQMLGSNLRAQGKLTQAESCLREALEMQYNVLSSGHPQTRNTIAELGKVLEDMGRGSEGQALSNDLAQRHPLSGSVFNEAALRDRLDRRRRTLGDQHPYVGTLLFHLGVLLTDAGRLDESESVHREALAIRQKGQSHSGIAESLFALGRVREMRGDLAGAETLFRESVEGRRKATGGVDADHVKHLGVLLEKLGNLPEAETCYRQVVASDRKWLPPESPETTGALERLGAVLLKQDKLAEAETVYREIVARVRHSVALSGAYPKLGQVLKALAEVFYKRNALKEAQAVMAEVVGLYNRHGEWPEDQRLQALSLSKRVEQELVSPASSGSNQ